MRILMLTQWFQPEPALLKGLPFAKELVRRGHQVEVLTGFPNYPDGQIYDGFQVRLWQREEMEGIRINRVALYPSHSKSGMGRILNYLSFSFSCLIFGPWLVCKPEIIYVYNLVTLSRTASFLRWLYGCRVVYDVQDLWPETVISSGMLPKVFYGFLKRWCLKAYHRADFIVAQSPGFQQNLQGRNLPKVRFGVIYNWCHEEESDSNHAEKMPSQPLLPQDENIFKIVFAGTMGVMQDLDVVLKAAAISAALQLKVRFFLVGSGVEKKRLEEKAEKMGLDNVVFLPRQPMAAMTNIYRQADALLVHLKKDPLFKITIPSKTQAYLAAGKPILMAMEGDAADLVEQAGAGYACEPENPEAMVECIKKICAMSDGERLKMGENGKTYYQEQLSFKCGVSKFESVFKSVLAP